MAFTKQSQVRHLKDFLGLLICCAALFSGNTNADVVNDWNRISVEIIVSEVKSPSMASHVLAMTQSSVFEAVNAITREYPAKSMLEPVQEEASVEAAVASANREMLMYLLPKQEQAIEAAYDATINKIPEGDARENGIKVGLAASHAVVEWRNSLKGAEPEPYRPQTVPGVYVPTVQLAGPNWGKRATWVLDSSDQLRPAAPPALESKEWSRDYNEVLQLGAKDSAIRTDDQTEAALFWQATAPSIYHPVLRSVTRMPGREVTQNARLLAIAARAIDDALVAVFDAKYHYQFWRPVTAIRNGDQDSNEQTERVADWTPLIPTPMHPEYPCAHCVVSGAIAGVLQAELDGKPVPTLSTTSPALPGVTRSWQSIDDFAQEVADARIYDGVHYRTSAETGTALGKAVAELAIEHAQ